MICGVVEPKYPMIIKGKDGDDIKFALLKYDGGLKGFTLWTGDSYPELLERLEIECFERNPETEGLIF